MVKGEFSLSGERLDITQRLIHRYYNGSLSTQKDVSDVDLNSESDENCNKNGDVNNENMDESGGGTFRKLASMAKRFFSRDYDRNVLIEKLTQEKQHATSYEEWLAAALSLDELTRTNEWKVRNETALYDYKLIENHTENMRQARLNRDYAQLLYLIRTTWIRNLGNMGNVNLYRHSHVGTKYLIDNYMRESKLALQELVRHSDLDENYLLGMLVQTRKNIGRTALVLSGGGTFGLFHIGVLATLFEQDLLPRVVSGSSAGAIVASILCSCHKREIVGLVESVLEKELNIFQDDSEKTQGENLLIKISRFFKSGTWFDNKNLVKTMIGFLGDLTFREAYNRTGKILNITVSPASVFEQPGLLNNLTAPNVLIWSAVCASCSLPGIFPSTPLYEKDAKTGETREWNSSTVKFVDGSVDNDLPISRLSEMFNVDHIIACQVNLHVFPFLKMSVSCVGGEIEDEFSARFRQNLSSVYNFVSNEIIHALEIVTELGIATNVLTKFRSILSQQYSGDITILPDMNMLLRMNELLANPSTDFLLRETVNGARATWPKISIIKNHCEQEFELDKAISYLKGKIISSPSFTTKNPFQFTDLSISLINTPEMPSNDGELPNVLDDTILNPHATDRILVINDNSKRPHSYGKTSISIAEASKSMHHHRRKSDSYAKGKSTSRYSLSHPGTTSSHISTKLLPTLMGYSPRMDRKKSVGQLPFAANATSIFDSNLRLESKRHSNSFTTLNGQKNTNIYSSNRTNPPSPLSAPISTAVKDTSRKGSVSSYESPLKSYYKRGAKQHKGRAPALNRSNTISTLKTKNTGKTKVGTKQDLKPMSNLDDDSVDPAQTEDSSELEKEGSS
ncbi:LANO_0H24366g1_1 [Lachancea nothofagi CBS 11611]|uniref:Patatin-like phospholipase domain-containing protein n=1 Tax=Lachancea nothofagi CBS 11611 TaxID=1266666 RepID=A0A1G4KNT7_9SACH|nr:LANO_0H24366g1_1 [Lachancea nothofagi CBS 11611]